MTVVTVPEALEQPPLGAHIVHIYEHADGLAASIVRFLGEALRGDESAVAIARTSTHAALLAGLPAAGIDVNGRKAAGRLRLIDAEAVLPDLLVDGTPDPDRFEEQIGCALDAARDAAPGGRVRAYGELVDLLWLAGRLSAALELERMWTATLETRPVTLLCGYAMRVLSPEFDGEAFARTCHAHSHTLLPYDRPRLQRAIDGALGDVLGGAQAAALGALIAATIGPQEVLDRVEHTVLWLRRNLPVQAEAVLAQARLRYDQED